MSNDKELSSVELFAKTLAEQGLLVTKDYKNLLAYKQAKAMHRKEHAKTWDDSLDNLKARGMNEMRAYTDFDDYFNNKYKK